MNSWKSSEFGACTPPLSTLKCGTGGRAVCQPHRDRQGGPAAGVEDLQCRQIHHVEPCHHLLLSRGARLGRPFCLYQCQLGTRALTSAMISARPALASEKNMPVF